jgi:membrane protein insertase Oxa1/YidC/SpoIIIJ
MPSTLTKAPLTDFHAPLHHPIVAVMQHITSPLTAALLIFSIHKTWQRPAMFASLRATRELWAAREWGTVPRPNRTTAVSGMVAVVAATALQAAFWGASAPPPPQLKLALQALYGERNVMHVASALSSAPSVSAAEALLKKVRQTTGAPWWAVIVGATLSIRMLLVPVNLLLLRNSLRMKLVLPEVFKLGAILAGDSSRAGRLAAAHELRSVFARGGCSPWSQVIMFPLLIPPAILTLFGAIHNLCLAGEGMADEGALFFPNLMSTDTTQLLPVASALSWLVNIEMGGGAFYAAKPGLRLAIRLGAVAVIPLSQTIPSGVLLFWVTSNLFAVVRGRLARLPWLRRHLGIPLHEQVLPYLPRAIGV